MHLFICDFGRILYIIPTHYYFLVQVGLSSICHEIIKENLWTYIHRDMGR